jgi:transposase
MHEEARRRLAYEVQRRKDRGDSERSISRALGIHPQTVRRLLQDLAARREAAQSVLEREVGPPPVRRHSKLDPFVEQIDSWLKTYENLTAVRLLEKLRDEGFTGSYTIVREHLKQLRGQATQKEAFQVIETHPGHQAQFDWSPYILPGCGQKVQLWGCSLGYSRARAFQAWDNSRQTTILSCLKRSFESFGGVPEQCVTDTMPGVVDRWECNQPILNLRFVDFAAHYRFAMDIAPRRCPRYKGKKERTFRFVEENLLNGRKFSSLEDFREVLAWWVTTHALQQKHPRTQRLIAQMLEEERPFLRPLPAHPYDTREILIRLVDTCALVQYQTNFYRVPDKHIGELVYVCADHTHLQILDRGVHQLAEHERLPDGAGIKPTEPDPHRRRYDLMLLLERLGAWGEIAQSFGQRLRQNKRYPGAELSYILGLQLTWSAQDIVQALSHAMSYDAYDARAIERILEARFKPRTLQDQIADCARSRIREVMQDNPVQQRPLSHYTALRLGDTPSLSTQEDSHDPHYERTQPNPDQTADSDPALEPEPELNRDSTPGSKAPS